MTWDWLTTNFAALDVLLIVALVVVWARDVRREASNLVREQQMMDVLQALAVNLKELATVIELRR